MNHRFAIKLKRALLAACAALGLAGASQAAYVEIIADPDYGPDFPGLGWRASAGLYVPDACLATYLGGVTTVQLATTPCTGSGPTDRPQLEDVTVYFYASVTPTPPLETIVLGTFLADAPVAVADPSGLTQELIDFTVTLADITSVKTSRSLIFAASNPLLGTDRFFSLHFDDDIAQLVQYDQDLKEVGRSSTARLAFSTVMSDDDYRRLRRLPEPGSIALVLVALAAGWASRRRPARISRLSE